MSNTRSFSEIQQEYANICARAGSIQYQIHTLAKELEMANNTLRDLNLEAAAAKAKEDESKQQSQGA